MTDGGVTNAETGRSEQQDIQVDDEIVDELADLLILQVRRSGRDSWRFSPTNLASYLDCDEQTATAALNALNALGRERLSVSVERTLAGNEWVARPVPGGML